MARKKPAGGGGAPEWLVTFADLMSLLVCFFVLIISFSIQDKQKMQLELQMMEADLELKQAMARKAMAEAARAESDAAAKKIESHMEQTGVNHARAMELQQAQAAGNQELTVTKALVTPRKIDQTAPDVEAAIGFNALSGRSTTGQLGA